jgi:hypothetical protein
VLGNSAKCSPAGARAQSIVATDEPRSGGYMVIYYPSERRWLLAPGCP